MERTGPARKPYSVGGYNTAGDRGIRREVVKKSVFDPSNSMAEQVGRRGAARKEQKEVKSSTLTSSTVI